ncbi:MAG: hypothetical protein JXB88_13715 [Spirochaetales bacterium]|nr:hypothetical protein [Spirochaetales bacterium]
MKSIIFLWLMVFLVTGVFCQGDVSFGVQAGGGILVYELKYGLDEYKWKTTNTDTILEFGAFVTSTYARLTVSYAMSLGGFEELRTVDDGDETVTTTGYPEDYTMSILNVELLGKYPIKLGSVVIWPAAGILYSMVLRLNLGNGGEDEDLTNYTLNDLYLSFGCGADFTMTGNFFVTANALFSFNLTPNRLLDEDLEIIFTPSGYTIRGYIGLGYRL